MEEQHERPQTAEIIPERRHRTRNRILMITGALLLVLALVAGGVSFAGYQYSEKYDGRILPGAVIAGVDVGGMTEEAALEAVRTAIGPQLDRTITVAWRKKTWNVTPRELGAKSNARAAVRGALAASQDTSFFEKTRMRLTGDRLGFERDVAISYPHQGARGFIKGFAASVDTEARDAAIDYSTGWVEITEAKVGHKVQMKRSKKALMTALREGDAEVDLAVKTVEPTVTEEAFDQVLLVRIGENKLYLYQDGEITHSWSVATGQPEYPTPTGLYEVTLKRYEPTWVNPSPDTWGANLPATIPPGPNNPLGVRAINWDAPAIRFHGTNAIYSLGYNASHGCVRMANSDVIELYDLIEVGTPIVSLQAGALKPLYGSSTAVDAETDAETGGGNGGSNEESRG